MFECDGKLVDEIKKGKRPLNLFTYFILGWIIYIVGALIDLYSQDVILSFFKTGSNETRNLVGFVAMLFGFIYTALMVIMIVKYIEHRKLSSLGFQSIGKSVKAGLFGTIVGIFSVILIMINLYLMGCVGLSTSPTQPLGINAFIPIILVFFGFIVQGGTEELVSRGWLLNVVSARYGGVMGIIISTLYFASTHLFNAGFNFIVFINIVLFSILLCMIVNWTGNLWYAIGFHGAWNFAIGNIFGLDVSGNKDRVGSLFEFTVSGPSFLTGGKFGIEGGIPTTFILGLLLIIIFFVKKYKKLHET